MTPDFFIHLTLATHRVANILPKTEPLGSQLKESANRLLVSLILLVEKNPVTPEQKLQIAPRAVREAGVLSAYLSYARRTALVNPENFLVLGREYARVGNFVRRVHEELTTGENLAPSKELLARSKAEREGGLSPRQERILALMHGKDRIQVWELQKVFPEVTKRTLRRDMDDLLQRSLVVRQGEWNEVFYQIR